MQNKLLVTALGVMMTGCVAGTDTQSSAQASSEPAAAQSSSAQPVSSAQSMSSSSAPSDEERLAKLEDIQFILGINVGGDMVRGENGLTYEADAYFTDGMTYSITGPVANADVALVYQSERYGDSVYEIPLPNGQYQAVLKYAELYWNEAAKRIVNASVEGQPVVQDLDIFATAGRHSAHDVSSTELLLSDGSLTIEVTSSLDNATLTGIEIYANKANTMDFPAEMVDAGAEIYEEHCADCHGESGEGTNIFPPLTGPTCKTCVSPAAMVSTISKTMPLSGDKCTGECAQSVAAYINFAFGQNNEVGGACEVRRAPIRRLTRFEYSNAIYDLLGDDSRPGNELPSEEIGNGFGNDALSMSVSTLLAQQYANVAQDIAQRIVSEPGKFQALHSCVSNVSSATENSCADQIIESLIPKAFRRAVTAAELQVFKDLQRDINTSDSFANSISAVIEAVLQAPEFLYRAEKGVMVDGRLKPTDYEMASRLSFFLWGSIPDQTLLTAAANGQLSTAAEVRAQAERMLEDPRAREMVRFFFDNYLPISALAHLERDADEFPTFNANIGRLMREETQRFMEHLIFDGAGDWASAFTSSTTFLNQELAEFYGIQGVAGSEFREVPMNTNQRMGFLTHAGVMAGTTHSGVTNPVARGAYIMKKMLCEKIPLPTGDFADEIKPPNPDSGATARERYSQHSENEVCATCHVLMDPVGLVFENFDPVGLYRTHENNALIDASGGLPGTNITVTNAVALTSAIAADDRTHQCFSYNWANFAYGKTIGASESCIKDDIAEQFIASGRDIKTLLLDLTQTDAFLNLPSNHRQ